MNAADYEIQRCTRRCAATDRELKPGEEFFSVLISEGADVVRHDYACDAWQGPPEANLVGWWKSQMPTAQMKRARMAPNDVLIQLFEEMAEKPDQQDAHYVLALLLLRRRIVRLEDTETDDSGEQMVLYCARNESTYRVRNVPPEASRIETIQDELARMLYAEPD